LNGPYQIIIEVQPVGAGTVQVNSLTLDQFPWTGNYFGGIPVILQTTPTSAQYTFDHWEMVNMPTPNATSDSIGVDLTQADHIIAVYKVEEITDNAFIATGFSPNNDGNNDMIYLHGLEGAQSFEFTVYNRWGQQVFFTKDANTGWDGKTNGIMNPAGVYAYVLNVTNVDGSSSVKTGNITLFR
jgi:gliding motility-associated-like protein